MAIEEAAQLISAALVNPELRLRLAGDPDTVFDSFNFSPAEKVTLRLIGDRDILSRMRYEMSSNPGDLVLFLCMVLLYMDGLKDKVTFAEILETLKQYEGQLELLKAKKLEQMLSARIEAESNIDLRWLAWVLIIIICIILFLCKLFEKN